MTEVLFIYCLGIYFWYHLLSRSDLLAKPRAWVLKTLPGWMTYPLSCCYCFTWWVGVLLIPFAVVFSVEMGLAWLIGQLFVAPVINLVVDLVVQALIRMNEPPVMGEGKTIWEGGSGISTWRAPSVVIGTAATSVTAGQMVVLKDIGGGPAGWEHTDRDHSPYRTSGIIRWWPGKLIGRRVRAHAGFIGEIHDGRTGKIVDGDGPSVFGYDHGCVKDCYWFYIIEPDDGKGSDRITVATNHCTFLDGLKEPFNPLNHEQSK